MLLGRRVRENSEYSQTYLTPLMVLILSTVASSLTSFDQVSGLWHQSGHAGSHGHKDEFLGSYCKASNCIALWKKSGFNVTCFSTSYPSPRSIPPKFLLLGPRWSVNILAQTQLHFMGSHGHFILLPSPPLILLSS